MDGPATVPWSKKKLSPSVLKMNKQRRQNSSSFLLCWDAMAEWLELGPAAAPATVLGSESTGRERRARGFYFGKPGCRIKNTD